MGVLRRTFYVFLGACALPLLAWWISIWVLGYCGDRRIYLDEAAGLKVGDGVYAEGKRIGRIRRVQSHGRRKVVDLRLHCRSVSSLNLYTTFFVDRDPNKPEHHCLRALSHGIPR